MGKTPSGAVRVICRFRPRNRLETEMNAPVVVDIVDDKVASIRNAAGKAYRFDFDHVFGMQSTQDEVFQATAEPMVDEVLQGYNSTIFAYGQTGSGKTFTMSGTNEMVGIIPRLIAKLFEGIEKSPSQIEFTIKVSYLEIYLEKVRDLLEPSHENLRIRESAGGMWVEGAVEKYVSTPGEVLGVMAAGLSNRAMASTRMNFESSRSHSVFIVQLHQLDTQTKSKKNSKLLLIDLAGSEKIEKTEATGTALKEAQQINKSLSALGNVINALTTNNAHIPYRDSKLTKLLSDSLGGNSLCCLIICASPAEYNVVETVTTCRFGQRAKMVTNKALINQEKSLAEYKVLLEEATKKLAFQEEIIRSLEAEIEEKTGIVRPRTGRASNDADQDVPRAEPQASVPHHRATSTIGGGSSAIVELQERSEQLQKTIKQIQDDNEELRDKLADAQSEVTMLTAANELLERHRAETEEETQEEDRVGASRSEEISSLKLMTDKLNRELEDYRIRSVRAEANLERLEGERQLRLDNLGSWTKNFTPHPLVDESSSIADQNVSLCKQYIGLFNELVSKVEKNLQMQEAYSDLEEELKAHRLFQEKGQLDDESSKLLAKRAFAETQAVRLRSENERLRLIEQNQSKMLDQWQEHASGLEASIQVMHGLAIRRDQYFRTVGKTLKREVESYRKLCLQVHDNGIRAASEYFLDKERAGGNTPMAHIHKPIQGGVRMSKVDWIKVLPSDVAFVNQSLKDKQSTSRDKGKQEQSI